MVHNDGKVWRIQESGTTQDLEAVWGSGATQVFAVGSHGTVLRRR